MSDYCKLEVGLEKSESISFYYAYNKKSTIDDLLEFIAYYFPEKNICPCFKFQVTNKNNEKKNVDGNLKFETIFKEYSNFILYNPKKECKCNSTMKNNFSKSKKEIIQNLANKSEKELNKSNIKIDEKSGQITVGEYMVLNKEANFSNFYDIIIDIKSIKDICKGWEIKLSEKAIKEYDNLKTNKVIRIGVIGNSNKGKSFLLSKISKINLPVGTNIRTEGLSVKYPDNLEEYEERRIVLLDSAGLETPVLEEEDIKKNKNDLFKEKSREKLITELFLQNYIINNSDILLIVVGILTYSEQKLLNKIKIQLKNSKSNKRIFVIHNLITFTKMEQVKEYIENILFKSITFKLEEGHKISTSTKSEDGFYYIEKDDDNKSEIQIYHYIMANENSEAGHILNDFTIKQLNNFFIVAKDKPFDVIETIKKSFVEMSKEMLEKTEEPIKLENFDNGNNKLIKINKPSEITLKKCSIDELGFSNLRTNGFNPVYNYYKKEDKLIVRVEAPGNCNFKSYIDKLDEYVYIRLEGTKKLDKEPEEMKDNIYVNREFGDFSLDIGLKASEYILKNEQPKISDRKGVFIFEYAIDKKKNTAEYKQEEEI